MVTEELVEGRVPDGLVHDVFLIPRGHCIQLGLLLTKCSQPLEHPEDRDYDGDRVPSGFHGLGGVVHDFLPPSRRVGR